MKIFEILLPFIKFKKSLGDLLFTLEWLCLTFSLLFVSWALEGYLVNKWWFFLFFASFFFIFLAKKFFFQEENVMSGRKLKIVIIFVVFYLLYSVFYVYNDLQNSYSYLFNDSLPEISMGVLCFLIAQITLIIFELFLMWDRRKKYALLVFIFIFLEVVAFSLLDYWMLALTKWEILILAFVESILHLLVSGGAAFLFVFWIHSRFDNRGGNPPLKKPF